uniref:Sulfotransferase n=1 Tax=Melopsittacus undulatus TaxID=13146 RepID=A0A8V5GM83_MELUD
MSHGYFQHEGITFPGLLYSPRGIEAAREFPVYDDDVFNVTYQKSGTVWMLEILSLIHSNGDPQWVQSVPNWDRGPWLETLLGLRRARGCPRPRLLSSHLPVQLFPKAFFGSKAKVIYTVRNPKDVLVSLYHFARIFRPYKDPGTLEQFMERFLQGDVPFGSWFDHVRGWMELRGQENFFCISYEELQQDLRGCVRRLCQFLDRPLGGAAVIPCYPMSIPCYPMLSHVHPMLSHVIPCYPMLSQDLRGSVRRLCQFLDRPLGGAAVIPCYPMSIPCYPMLSHVHPMLSHVIPCPSHVIPCYPMLSHVIPCPSHVIPCYPMSIPCYPMLSQDLRGSVRRLCQFLDRPLGGAAVDAIVANASFAAMSSNRMSNFSLSPRFILDMRRGTFLRKGISGDWKNHLTPEQSARFDHVYRERMGGVGLTFPWDPPEEEPEAPPTEDTPTEATPTEDTPPPPVTPPPPIEAPPSEALPTSSHDPAPSRALPPTEATPTVAPPTVAPPIEATPPSYQDPAPTEPPPP